MAYFFDPNLIQSAGAAFIREDKVESALARLIPGVRVTKGHYSCVGHAEIRDLVWNHMDQNHRPFVHRTYGDAMRMFVGTEGAMSLPRFGRLPIVLPVFDGYYKRNGFYQVMSLLGLIVVVVTIEAIERDGSTYMEIDWAIASNRFLKFLHGPLGRRLWRLNDVQNREDEEIRKRRTELRACGYSFLTDDPNFLNSNAIANNVVYPRLSAEFMIAVAEFAEGVKHRVEVEGRAYILRRAGAAMEVWPGVCPHEGAMLRECDVGTAQVKCPWHGLEFNRRLLSEGHGEISLCGARLSLVGDAVRVRPE